MNQAIDPPRLLSIDKFHSTPDQHSFEVDARSRHVDHHRRAWSGPEVPVLVCMARRRNADVVTNSQEPHRQDVDAVVLVQCGQVCDKCHRKDLIDLGEQRTGGLSAAASLELLAISSSSINIPDHIHNLCYRYVILVLFPLVY